MHSVDRYSLLWVCTATDSSGACAGAFVGSSTTGCEEAGVGNLCLTKEQLYTHVVSVLRSFCDSKGTRPNRGISRSFTQLSFFLTLIMGRQPPRSFLEESGVTITGRRRLCWMTTSGRLGLKSWQESSREITGGVYILILCSRQSEHYRGYPASYFSFGNYLLLGNGVYGTSPLYPFMTRAHLFRVTQGHQSALRVNQKGECGHS